MAQMLLTVSSNTLIFNFSIKLSPQNLRSRYSRSQQRLADLILGALSLSPPLYSRIDQTHGSGVSEELSLFVIVIPPKS